MAGTKNLGQVAGLFIGTTPPENTSLIWYDSTPSMQCHKVYSVTLGQWVVLDDNTILAVEYSVLRNRAQDPGLSVGQWFKITDKDNALALAITSTKVQYVDSIGNILIDDLSASIQYHVTHQNLLIDDVHGVFDTVNKRLVFEFSEVSAVNFVGEDFILAERKVNNVWSLFKIKFSKLLSKTSGNAIVWDNGFYLNFTQLFTNMLNAPGGAVSKATFDSTIASIRTDLTNVSNNQQSMAEQAAAAIDAAVTDDMIFDKRLPEDPDVSTGPADILEGDTLQMIVNKVQRWFNSLKWATGIGLSDDYAEATENFNVNNNDSVETAIAKLAGHVRALQVGSDNGTDNIIVSNDYNPSSDNNAGAGSVLTLLLSKFGYLTAKHENTDGITLKNFNEPVHHDLVNNVTALTDVLEELAFRINRNKQPIFSMIMFNQAPTYSNVQAYAGYGWFPCGIIMSGTQAQCESEKYLWESYYSGVATLNFSVTFISGSNYYLILNSITPAGGSVRNVPNVTKRTIRGFDPTDGSMYIGRMAGSDVVTIGASNLPNHTHTVSSHTEANHDHGGSTTGADGSHSHAILNNGGREEAIYSDDDGSSGSSYGNHGTLHRTTAWTDGEVTIKTGGSHQHTITAGGGFTHSHTVNGGGQASPTALSIANPMILTSFLIRLL